MKISFIPLAQWLYTIREALHAGLHGDLADWWLCAGDISGQGAFGVRHCSPDDHRPSKTRPDTDEAPPTPADSR